MKFQKRLAGIVSLCAFSLPALATEHVPNGIYVNVGAGITGMAVADLKKNDPVVSLFEGEEDYKIESAATPFIKTSKSKYGGLSYKAAVGYADSMQPFRGEVEYLQINQKLKYEVPLLFQDGANPQIQNFKSEIKSKGIYLINVYVDLWTEHGVVMPYLTAGVGYSSSETKWSGEGTVYLTEIPEEDGDDEVEPLVYPSDPIPFSGSETTDSLAWQVGAGARIKLTNNFLVDLTFQYINLGRVKWALNFQGTDVCEECTCTVSVRNEQEVTVRRLDSMQATLSASLFFGGQESYPSLIKDV